MTNHESPFDPTTNFTPGPEETPYPGPTSMSYAEMIDVLVNDKVTAAASKAVSDQCLNETFHVDKDAGMREMIADKISRIADEDIRKHYEDDGLLGPEDVIVALGKPDEEDLITPPPTTPGGPARGLAQWGPSSRFWLQKPTDSIPVSFDEPSADTM